MMYIGLDLGTSGLKGILIGGDQAVLAEATAPLTVQRPHEGWSEQAPSDWISAAETPAALKASVTCSACATVEQNTTVCLSATRCSAA